MNNKKIHNTISADGTKIVGSVYGQGHPLVFLPPGPANSEQGWQYLVPFLIDRFTCYLMKPRGRGQSGDHLDHSPQRLVEDVLAFAKSIGEPVVLVEWGSGLWAYTAAKNDPVIKGVAVYEPGVDEVMPADIADQLGRVFEQVEKLAAENHLLEAAEFFIGNSHILYTGKDLASGMPQDLWKTAAPNLPVFLHEQHSKW